MTLNEYIEMNKKQFPELINFAGFLEDDICRSDIDFMSQQNENMDDSSNHLYDEHLSFDEMVLGVKEGRYFQGRFNISRVV